MKIEEIKVDDVPLDEVYSALKCGLVDVINPDENYVVKGSYITRLIEAVITLHDELQSSEETAK